MEVVVVIAGAWFFADVLLVGFLRRSAQPRH